MRKISLKQSVFLLLVGMVVACNEDDGPSYKFKDQDASGKIDNVAWTYADGYASIYDDGDGSKISFTLTLAQAQQGCDIFIPEGNLVLFDLPYETGLYKLKFDLNGNPNNSHTVTLLEHTQFLNIICTEGAVEILTITETEVTGRLDARYDSQSHVNGNFTVSICP